MPYVVAEEVGFEPTVDFHLRRFSRPVHSTTLPLLRHRPVSGSFMIRKAGSRFGENPPKARARAFQIPRSGAIVLQDIVRHACCAVR